jgi:hypothetical protein
MAIMAIPRQQDFELDDITTNQLYEVFLGQVCS